MADQDSTKLLHSNARLLDALDAISGASFTAQELLTKLQSDPDGLDVPALLGAAQQIVSGIHELAIDTALVLREE